MPKRISHAQIIKLHKRGMRQTAIAKTLDVSRRSVWAVVKEYETGDPFGRSEQISEIGSQKAAQNKGFLEAKNEDPTNTITPQKCANKLTQIHQGKLIETKIPDDVVKVITDEELLNQEGYRIVTRRGPNETELYGTSRPKDCLSDCVCCLIDDECELFVALFGTT